jgi:hypothetical protein
MLPPAPKIAIDIIDLTPGVLFRGVERQLLISAAGGHDHRCATVPGRG